jgi:hypothetical protein
MTSPVDIQLDKLKGLPVQNGINASDFLKQPINPTAIGPISSAQVKGLLGQLEASNKIAPTAVTINGVGAYGIPPQQLELAGFLKTGTTETYLKGGANVTTVLNSPAVWTGKNGISSLSGFIANNTQQATAAFTVMQSAYNSLAKQGNLSATSVNGISAMLYGSVKFGTENMVLWSRGQASGNIVNQINQAAKQGSFAIGFVNELPLGASGQAVATGFAQVTNRNLIDTVVSRILNNNKIPRPKFG